MVQEKELSKAFIGLVSTIGKLRDPDGGCPWDRKQTHESLRRFMIEEAYEASDAMAEGKIEDIIEELGDVLLQVILNARIAEDHGDFSMIDVIRKIDLKMKGRHPHVFSAKNENKPASDEELRGKWERLKKLEKKSEEGRSLFTDLDKKIFPSTTKALKIGKLAKEIDFDWGHPTEVLEKLESEFQELKQEFISKEINMDHVRQEIGDIYFTLAQFCRHLHLDPEITAQDGNRKFLDRFSKLESLAKEEGIDLLSSDLAIKEKLWEKAKKIEKNKE
ncbi:MAG: nucleoside triphosphate pyrophosphohydrolase [Oligoflexales bacterium]|nr:nucleoside triphosphate pyrophosphohydrolase [Oligoflexales bacterium]